MSMSRSTGFAIGRAGKRPHEHVGHLLDLENLDDVPQQLSLMQGGVSSQFTCDLVGVPVRMPPCRCVSNISSIVRSASIPWRPVRRASCCEILDHRVVEDLDARPPRIVASF